MTTKAEQLDQIAQTAIVDMEESEGEEWTQWSVDDATAAACDYISSGDCEWIETFGLWEAMQARVERLLRRRFAEAA